MKERKDISAYLTSPEQSQWLEEHKIQLDHCFFWVKTGETEGKPSWEWSFEQPEEGTEYLKAYLFEQLEAFLPHSFVLQRIQALSPTKEKMLVSMLSPHPVFYKDLVKAQQLPPCLRSIDSVFNMIGFLILNKFMQPDKPGQYFEPKVIRLYQ